MFELSRIYRDDVGAVVGLGCMVGDIVGELVGELSAAAVWDFTATTLAAITIKTTSEIVTAHKMNVRRCRPRIRRDGMLGGGATTVALLPSDWLGVLLEYHSAGTTSFGG
jgi:hypothetical protein